MLTREAVLGMIVVATSASGCMASLPIENVAPLLNEARQNEVAAYAKNRGQDKRVTGVVLHSGLERSARVVAEHAGFQTYAHVQAVPYPVLVLGDPQAPAAGIIKCYFDEEDVEEVGRVALGSRVVLRGTFHSYERQDGRLVLVLAGCSVE